LKGSHSVISVPLLIPEINHEKVSFLFSIISSKKGVLLMFLGFKNKKMSFLEKYIEIQNVL